MTESQSAEHAKARLFAQLAARRDHGTTCSFRARGGSMYPFVRDGDVVELCQANPNKARRGDIVVTDHGTQILCHRLMRKQRRGSTWFYITQGDTLLHEDPPVAAPQVLGLVTTIRSTNSDRFHLTSRSGLAARRLYPLLGLVKSFVSGACSALGFPLDSTDTSRAFRRILQGLYLCGCFPLLVLHWCSRSTPAKEQQFSVRRTCLDRSL